MIVDLDLVASIDGKALAVVRPDNPELALKLAHQCLALQDGAGFERLLQDVQESGSLYRFAGWLSPCRKFIVDETGKRIDSIRPGDSFVTHDALQLAEDLQGS